MPKPNLTITTSTEIKPKESFYCWFENYIHFVIELFFIWAKERGYFGTCLHVLRSGCDEPLPLWFAVMSAWENSSWEFSLCSDWSSGIQTRHIIKTGLSINLRNTENHRNNSNWEGEGSLLSSGRHLGVTLREVEWEEICRWCQWSPISGVCSPPNSQWTVVTPTQSTTPTASVRVNAHKVAFCFIA